MNGLVAQDAVVENVLRVRASDSTATAERLPRGSYYAVFRAGSSTVTVSDFLELIPAHVVPAGQPKSFGEFLPKKGVQPIPGKLSLPETLKRLRIAGAEAVPLVDENGQFAGAVSQKSILDALLKRERELIKKSREVRQTVSEDKRRLYDTVRRLEQVNQAFKKLLGGLVRPAGPEVFQRIIEALAVVCEADYAAVNLLDESGRSRETIVAGSAPAAADSSAHFLEQRWQLLEQVVQENRILNIPDVPKHFLAKGKPLESTPISSFLGVPIAREGHVFGCAYVCNKRGVPRFTDDDEELVASYAAGVGLSLAQVRESARRRRAERERDMLARAGLRLTSASTVEQLAEVVRSTTEEFWKWDAFSLAVRRSGHGKMQYVLEIDHSIASGETGESEEDFPRGSSGPDSGRVLAPSSRQGVSGMYSDELDSRLKSGEAVLINRCLSEPGPELDRFGDVTRPSASMMFAPMLVEGALVGILSVQSYTEDRFHESDLNLLRRLADVVGPALRRCLAERRSDAFSSLGYRLSMVTEPEDAARVIVEVADQLIGWDACSVYLYNAEENLATNVLHMDLVEGESREISPNDMIATPGIFPLRTIREGPQLILRKELTFAPGDTVPFGDCNRPSASLMFVPLRVGSRVTGILSIQSYTVDAYDEGDLHLLQGLADHCSGALERTRIQQEANR